MFRCVQCSRCDGGVRDGLLHAGLPRADCAEPGAVESGAVLRDADLRAERRGRTEQPSRASFTRRTCVGGCDSSTARAAGDSGCRGRSPLRVAAIVRFLAQLRASLLAPNLIATHS